MSRIRGLTLHQPWATLVVRGEKKFETRKWKTDYRGLLLITSAQKIPPEGFELQRKLENERGFDYGGMLNIAPLGMALGTVELVEIYPTDNLVLVSYGAWERESPLGDFRSGRYAWKLKNPVEFEKPFPIRGNRMLWKVRDRNCGANTTEALRSRGIKFWKEA